MAKDVNRYESVLLDKMTDIWREGRTAGMTSQKQAVDNVLVLLDCIVDFREPPGEPAIEDGFGAMAREVGE